MAAITQAQYNEAIIMAMIKAPDKKTRDAIADMATDKDAIKEFDVDTTPPKPVELSNTLEPKPPSQTKSIKKSHYNRPRGVPLEQEMAYTRDYDRGKIEATQKKNPPTSPSQGYKDGYADGVEELGILDAAFKRTTDEMFSRWGMKSLTKDAYPQYKIGDTVILSTAGMARSYKIKEIHGSEATICDFYDDTKCRRVSLDKLTKSAVGQVVKGMDRVNRLVAGNAPLEVIADAMEEDGYPDADKLRKIQGMGHGKPTIGWHAARVILGDYQAWSNNRHEKSCGVCMMADGGSVLKNDLGSSPTNSLSQETTAANDPTIMGQAPQYAMSPKLENKLDVPTKDYLDFPLR